MANKTNAQNWDVIIVGAGIAGLYAALHLPKNLKVLLLCKDQPWECNSFYAQGGIATARNKEDIDAHIKDTLDAGAGMCDLDAVRTLSLESLEILEDLLKREVPFDKDANGNLLFTKEAAHSCARIIHAGGDCTGRVVHSYFMGQMPHTLWKNATVTELLIEGSHCYGVSVQTKRGNYNLYANHVILASGGVGALFEYHTNAYTIAGELHGMILENNLKLADMEMLQFHPTVFVETPNARKSLLSEALRGEGARVVNAKGEQFLFKYDKRGELAPRDCVSRGIYSYLREHKGEKVYLDLSNFSEEFFKKRFPNIYRNIRLFGFDIPKERIPISPAYHYCMGGIATDKIGKVLEMDNLYAIGECARSGVHGANRLASNSLLEALVFARKVAQTITQDTPPKPTNSRNHRGRIIQSASEIEGGMNVKMREFPLHTEILEKESDANLKQILRKIMWDKVGIIRNQNALNEALGGVEVMLQSGVGRLFRLRLLTAKAIIESALARGESVGAHFMQP